MTYSALLAFVCVPTLITGVFLWLFNRRMTKRDKKREAVEGARKERDLYIIDYISAVFAMGEATAIAVRDKKCNGDMTAALDYARIVKHKHRDFLNRQAIENLQ